MIRRNRGWVILRQIEGTDDAWQQVTAIVAPTRRAAVHQATLGDHNPYPSGTFKAIPVKEWAHEIEVPSS